MITMQLANEAYRLEQKYGAAPPVAPSRLIAAKRDSAAFQLIFSSNTPYSIHTATNDWYSCEGPRTRVRELVGDHVRLRVAVDSLFSAKLYIEDLLTDDDGVKKADLLLNAPDKECMAGESSAVFVEVDVPADAVAGDYTVRVSLYASTYIEDEHLVATAELPLRIMDYTLPAPADWSFYLDLWQNNSNIARKHDVVLWSDAHFAVMKPYIESLAALGQKSITVCASEIPWEGQSSYRSLRYGGNLFEYSMIPITREQDGSFTFDYSVMQRYIDMCRAAGISGDIEVFGLVNIWHKPDYITEAPCPDYPEPIRLRYFDRADGCMKYVREAEVIRDYIRSLERYFIETNQIDRVRIAADEPSDIDRYRASLALLAELAPAFRRKTAINHAEFIEEFGDQIDDFAPALSCANKAHDALMHYRKKYPNKKFLWYFCTGPARPNLFLRSPLTEARMMGPLTDILGFDGVLRWSYTVWPEDPCREIRFSNFEAGDTNVVYPARNGDVQLSLRYKNLQRGIADYELIHALRELGKGEAADAIIKRLQRIEKPYDYYLAMKKRDTVLHCNDWEEFNAVKAELLSLLAE